MDNANISSDYNESSLHEECSIRRHRSGPWNADPWPSERSEEDYSGSDIRIPPAVSRQASQLRQYLTKLQSTIDSIISGSETASDSEPPVEDLTSQLHDEYQMMSGTLNQLESLLLGQQNAASPDGGLIADRSGSNVRAHEELGLLDCVVTDRDEVIRRLSERVRALCRANDQLYMDFESQEQLLTTEMRQLRRQLEEANHAIQLLACHDCSPRAETAVQGGVTVMRAAEEKIAQLRAELQEKEQLLQHLQTGSAPSIALPELARLLHFSLGDLECGPALAVDQLHSAEAVRGVLQRLRAECLRLQKAAEEAHSGCMTARSSAQQHTTSLAHFQHRFAEQSRTLMQRVELRAAGGAAGHRLKASWAALTNVDAQSAAVSDVFEVTLRFLQDLFDFLTEDMQLQDKTVHQLKGQLESMLQECNSVKSRTAQLQMWNRDSEERIQQMERDRDEEMEIARRERSDALARCQGLVDHVTRLKAELETERAERCKAMRESQTIRDQVDRSSRRSSEFEQRYISAQEELAHQALRMKQLEETCAHLETELATQRLQTDELTVKLECGSKASEEANAAYRKLCDQVAGLQAQRARLEERLAAAAAVEGRLQQKEAEEAALRGEMSLLQRDMEASRRSHAALLQQQNEEAMGTIARLKQELEIVQSEVQRFRSVSKGSAFSQTEDSRTKHQQLDSVSFAKTGPEDRSSPVIVECSGRAATPPGDSECSCEQPVEVSEVVVELPAREADEMIARYEARMRAMELEMNAHAHAHVVAILELQEGIRARDALVLKLNDILTDICTTMNDDRVPVHELRLLFSSHAELPLRVESQLRGLRSSEEHALLALGRAQQELSARHHEVLEHELDGEGVGEAISPQGGPSRASPTAPMQASLLPKPAKTGLSVESPPGSAQMDASFRSSPGSAQMGASFRSPPGSAQMGASFRSPPGSAQMGASFRSPPGSAQIGASVKSPTKFSSQPASWMGQTSQLGQMPLRSEASLAAHTSQGGQNPLDASVGAETSVGFETSLAGQTSQLAQTSFIMGQTITGQTSLAQGSLAGQTSLVGQASFAGQTSLAQGSFGGQPSRVGQASFAGQTSPGSQASFAGQTSLAGQASFAGQTSLADQASFAGQTSLADQASFAGQASLAGQASFAGQTSLGGQASFAGQASLGGQASFAGQASPTSRLLLPETQLVNRLLSLKRQLENPQTAQQVNVLQRISECLKAHAESVKSIGKDAVSPSQATSAQDSRAKWVIGTDSVDLPEAVLSDTQLTTPVGFESRRVCMLLELFDLEKNLRYAPLEEKTEALKNLAAAKRKMLEETDEWDDDREDVEVVISLIESMSLVVSLEAQKRTLERKFRLSVRQAEKVMRIGKEGGAAYLKKTLLSMSSVCQKTPSQRQSVLLELMQTHVDSMRHVPPQELIVMTSVTEVLKCLLHMCDLEIKVEEVEKAKEQLKLQVTADRIVLENLTHFRIPVVHGESLVGEAAGSTCSEEFDDLSLQEPSVPIPSSTPAALRTALEALQHMSSQPTDSRRAGLQQLMEFFKENAKKEKDSAERDNFHIAAAMLEVAIAIDAIGEQKPQLPRHSRTSSVCRLSSVLEDVSTGQGLISTIDNYKSMLNRISECKTKVETQLALHVLDSVDTEARQEREAAISIVKEIDDLLPLKAAKREAVLKDIQSRLAKYDLDQTSMQIFNSFIPLVIQCLREIETATKTSKDARQTSDLGEFERQPSPKTARVLPDAAEKRPTSAARTGSEAALRPDTPRKAEPRDAAKAQAERKARSQATPPPGAKGAVKALDSPQASDEEAKVTDEGKKGLRSPASHRVPPKGKEKPPHSPQVSDDEGTRSRPATAQRSQSKGKAKSSPLSQALDEGAGKPRQDTPLKSVPKGAAGQLSPQRSVAAAKSRDASPQKPAGAQAAQGRGTRKPEAASKDVSKPKPVSAKTSEEDKRFSQSSSFSEGVKFPVSSVTKKETLTLSSMSKPMAAMFSSEVKKPEKQSVAKDTSDSERAPLAAPRRSSSREMEALLDHIPSLLCDEVLSYVEARLPPSSEALLKEVQDTRARRSNRVRRSISTEKLEKPLNCMLVVRLAEAVEEEAQLRKLPPAQQRAALERVLKRFDAHLPGASEEQKHAIHEAKRYLRGQLLAMSRSSGKHDTVSAASKASTRSRSKAVSTHHSDISCFFFRSDTLKSLAGIEGFPDEVTLEALLARVPAAIKNEAFHLIEDRLSTAHKSLADGVASFKDVCLLEQQMPEELIVPVARRIIDALRLVDTIKDKSPEAREAALKAALEEQELMLGAANAEERAGIHSACRIFCAELSLLRTESAGLVSTTSRLETDSLKSQKKALDDERKRLEEERRQLEGEKKKLEKQTKETRTADRGKDVRDSSDSSIKKSAIPSPSNIGTGHRRRSLVSGHHQASDLKRFAEVLGQQCSSWLDAEEQCAQEMNHMARRLSQIGAFLSQDCWSEYTTSRALDQASGGVLTAVLLVRKRVTPKEDDDAILTETTALVERLETSQETTHEVALLLVQEKAALRAQVSGLVGVNRELQEQCRLSREAIKDTAGALTVTSQAIDVLTDRLEVDRAKNENVDTGAPGEHAGLRAAMEAELARIEGTMKLSNAGDVPSRLQALGLLLLQLREEKERLARENMEMCGREVTMEPEGDRPVQFQFETRLGAAGNVEGHVTMLKEGVEEPMQLDFSMMLAGSESAGTQESHNAAAIKPPSPSRLGRALQRLTKRRRRSPEVAGSNQNNAWPPLGLCAGCRAPLTATTASVAPGLCAACAGGDSDFSSVSTLTATDSWEAPSEPARADPPRLLLCSPPRPARLPAEPLPAPRTFSAEQRRQRAEQRLEAAAAFLRKSLTRSMAAPDSLRKPVFFRDIRR